MKTLSNLNITSLNITKDQDGDLIVKSNTNDNKLCSKLILEQDDSNET